MSLHTPLSPEAQATLATQKRNSMISSIVIALLACTLIGLILWIITLQPFFKNNEETFTYSAPSDTEADLEKTETTDQVQTNPSPPTSNMAKVIVNNTPSPTAIPVPEVTIDEPSLEYGDSQDLADGWGDSFGDGMSGGQGIGIPASMQKRCTEADRRQRLSKEGGKPKYEDQVVLALKWLQKTQAEDGSWKEQGKPVAMTGLALLAYLGHCETPSSAEFGTTVQRAIIYLINVGNSNEGKLASSLADNHWCYEHAIATYALAEAYTLCKEFKVSIPRLEETVKAAGGFIINNQHKSGGWDYSYATSSERGGDTSVTCWHLQALKACKMTGIPFKKLKKSAKAGIRYLQKAKNGKGTIGYETNGKNLPEGPTMTPAGVLCFQQWGKAKTTLATSGIKWIRNNSQFDYKTNANLYMHYYSSQALINAQGKAWSEYNASTMANMADAQNSDGSWDLPGNAKHGMESKHYATCLCTLMLETYYRFLPGS